MTLNEAPTLETERLILRAFRTDDLDPLGAMWADPEVVRFIGGHVLSREDTWRRSLAACGQWPYTGFGYWVAERKSDGKVVGQAGFADFKRDMQPSIEGEPELGYVFSPKVHGQGMAHEACAAALEWADANLDAASYPAIISPENAASIRLAERLGFERAPDAIYRGEMIALFRRAKP
ncbi:MAG TPA: GNAT family N-acetyltransferase [Sphingomicrobium sp.]|nr:GNAT family N-acetyltransferase [Sphingomicrobium sp.]